MTDNQESTPDFEIVEAERVFPLYFNGKIIAPDFELHRLNTPAGRIYFYFEGETPIFFAGTGAIERELPKNENLEEAMADMGWVSANRKKNMRMLAGSFLHSRFADLCMNGIVDFDELPQRLSQYYNDQNFYIMDSEHYALVKEIRKDLIGIQQWIRDNEVEFIGIEYPVFSKELQLATQLDAWCFATIREGSGKNLTEERCMCIVDLKIGKWGHSLGHRYQLYAGQQMLIERHPEFIDHKIRLFNLTGKNFRTLDWNRKTMPYKFTECTDNIDVHDFDLTAQKAIHHMEARLNKTFMYVTGKMKLTDDPKSFIVHKTIRDFVIEGDWKRFTKTSASIPESSMVFQM